MCHNMRVEQRVLLRYLIDMMTGSESEDVNVRAVESEMEETFGYLWYEFRDDALNEVIR